MVTSKELMVDLVLDGRYLVTANTSGRGVHHTITDLEFIGFASRVSDGKWGRFYNTDSNHGRQPCPIGKNNMFWSYSHNKDDPGLYFQVYEMPNMFAKHNNGDNWSQMDSNWSTWLLDTLATALDILRSSLHYIIHHCSALSSQNK